MLSVVLGGFVLPMAGDSVEATSTVLAASAANVGMQYYRLNNGETQYQDALDGVNGTLTTLLNNHIAAGQRRPDSFPTLSYAVYRGVIAFNTSGLDTDFSESIELFVKTYAPAWQGSPTWRPNGTIQVYSRPATESTFNWTNLPTNCSYVGDLVGIPSANDGAWYSITVPSSALGTGDWSAEYGAGMDTVFYLVSSREGTTATFEEYMVFSYADPPYLSIAEKDNGEATVSYYVGAGSCENITILPVERMEYNNTYDMLRYEIYVLNYTMFGAEWMVITLDEDYNYLTNANFATVTDLGGGSWNITNYPGGPVSEPSWPSYYMHLWFATPIDPPETELSIQLWHETLGEGIMWEKFAVYVSEGATYNESIATLIPTPTTHITAGLTYTFAVLDLFDNIITTKTATISGSFDNIKITVPVHQVTINSFRNDTTAFAIYFNATGDPYQDHCSGGKEVKLGIREGAYMFRFDYCTSNATGHNTITATYFYNLTINATHTMNIGTDGVGILITDINGMEITVNTIGDWLTPSIQNIYFLLPEYPYGGTRGVGSLTETELTYVSYHPYHIIDGDIKVNGSGNNVSLADYRPTNGSVRWVSDVLYINSNPSNAIMVNDSTGNILNLSTAPAYVDLIDYELGDITVWSNGTIEVHRISQFRQVQRLLYDHHADTGRYFTSAAAYNPTAGQWRPVYWFIGYATDSDGDVLRADTGTIRLYDVDNSLVLQPGANYEIGGAGVEMMFEYLNTTIDRNMQLSYFLDNNTPPLSTPILKVQSFSIGDWEGSSYYQGSTAWTNNATQSYQGGIYISLKGLTGDVDVSSIHLVNSQTEAEIPDYFWTFSGNSIYLAEAVVGEVSVGEKISYDIYFKYDGVEGDPFFLFDGKYNLGWLNLNWHLSILFAALGCSIYGAAEFITARKQKHEAKGFAWLLIGAIMACLYVLLYLWHVAGVL